MNTPKVSHDEWIRLIFTNKTVIIVFNKNKNNRVFKAEFCAFCMTKILPELCTKRLDRMKKMLCFTLGLVLVFMMGVSGV